MYKERHYYFQNTPIGSFLKAAMFGDRDDPWLPACFPLLWERGIRTSFHGNDLLSPAWQLEPGSLHTFPFTTEYFFDTNVSMTDLSERRVCSGYFLFSQFLFSHTIINGLFFYSESLVTEGFNNSAVPLWSAIITELSWIWFYDD